MADNWCDSIRVSFVRKEPECDDPTGRRIDSLLFVLVPDCVGVDGLLHLNPEWCHLCAPSISRNRHASREI